MANNGLSDKRLTFSLLARVLCLGLVVSFVGAQGVEAQEIDSIALNSTLNVGSLNWPDGTWHVRAVLLDEFSNPVGALVAESVFSLSSEWPSIAVTMVSNAPSNYQIRFYRSNSAFSVGEPNIESNQVNCGASLCDTAVVSSVALSNTLNGGWSTATVLPVELTSFEVE